MGGRFQSSVRRRQSWEGLHFAHGPPDSTNFFNKTEEDCTYLKGWGNHPGPGSPSAVLKDGLLHVKVVRVLQASGAYCTLLKMWNKQSK